MMPAGSRRSGRVPTVAPVPNLENLRKQAKLYVRWHREGYYPVAAQIRAVLPRFKDLTDRLKMVDSIAARYGERYSPKDWVCTVNADKQLESID